MRAEFANQSSERGLHTTSSYVKAVAVCQLNESGQKDTRMQMSADSQSIVIQPIAPALGTHLAFLTALLFTACSPHTHLP